MNINFDDRLWYGEYGGCFVADAFTITCDDYFDEYKKIVSSQAFVDEYHSLSRKVCPKFIFEQDATNQNLCICHAPENFYSIVGSALFAKLSGRHMALCGARYIDEALLCAKVCAHLGIKLQLFLAKEISGVASMMEQLKLLGVSCEVHQCETLFNLPEMYAFQAWISAPDGKALIHCRSNVGAYPQTNIATGFLQQYGACLCESLAAEGLEDFEEIVVPMVTGSFALGIVKAFMDKGFCLTTVECDTEEALSEELDSYCGTFTKVMRNNYIDRVIAPELAALHDNKQVKRAAEKPQNLTNMLFGSKNLSLQSLAALEYCKGTGKKTLCIVRSLRGGTAI